MVGWSHPQCQMGMVWETTDAIFNHLNDHGIVLSPLKMTLATSLAKMGMAGHPHVAKLPLKKIYFLFLKKKIIKKN
jgi:hypothetical protein